MSSDLLFQMTSLGRCGNCIDVIGVVHIDLLKYFKRSMAWSEVNRGRWARIVFLKESASTVSS